MKIAVCDDEKILRKQLSAYIKSYSDKSSVDEYENGWELLNSNVYYDIIFLDIEMPGINGMDVAEILRNKCIDTHIVFLTSHIEYIYDAFKVKAFRFLNKPINISELIEAMRGVEAEILNKEKIVINRKGRIYYINLKDIVYLEAFGDGTYVYDKYNNVYECSVQLKEWNKNLQGKGFFKIHKSFIVSFLYVKKVENHQLELFNISNSFTISRRNLSMFKEEYLQYIKNNSRVI